MSSCMKCTILLLLTLLLVSSHATPLGYFYDPSSPYLALPRSSENCNDVRKQFSEGYILLSEFMQRIRSCSEPGFLPSLSYGRKADDLVQPQQSGMTMVPYPYIPYQPTPLSMVDFSQGQPYTYSNVPAYPTTTLSAASTWAGNFQLGSLTPSLNQGGTFGNFPWMGNFNGRSYINPSYRHNDFGFVSYSNPNSLQQFAVVGQGASPLPVKKVFVSDRGNAKQDRVTDILLSPSSSILKHTLVKTFETKVPTTIGHANSTARNTLPDRQVIRSNASATLAQFPLERKHTSAQLRQGVLNSPTTTTLNSPTTTTLNSPTTTTLTDNDFLDITLLGLKDDASFLDTGPRTSLAASLTLSNVDTLTSQMHEARSKIRSTTSMKQGQNHHYFGGGSLAKKEAVLDQIMTKLGSNPGQSSGKETAPFNIPHPGLDLRTSRYFVGGLVPSSATNAKLVQSSVLPEQHTSNSPTSEDAEYERLKSTLLDDIRRRQILITQLERKKLKRTKGYLPSPYSSNFQLPRRNVVEISQQSLQKIFKQIEKRTTDQPWENFISNDLGTVASEK